MKDAQTATENNTGDGLPDLTENFGSIDQANLPSEFELLTLNKTPSGVFLTVVGKDSEAYRALSRKNQNKRFAELRKTRTLTMTAEGNEEEALNLLSAVVRGWRSRVFTRDADNRLVPTDSFKSVYKLKGELLDCNGVNVKRVLREVPEIRDQLEDYLDDRANFLKGSQPT